MPAYVRFAPDVWPPDVSPPDVSPPDVPEPAGAEAARWGIVEEGVIAELTAAPFNGGSPTGEKRPLDVVTVLAPATPSKVIAVGLNYRSHLGERPAPKQPGLFAKLPSSIIGPGEAIRIPPDAEIVHAEGELVVVIGRPTRDVDRTRAADHIFGVTAGNDVSERTWQRDDLQWLRAKGSDSFGPLGPRILTDLDYDDLLLQTRLNGEVVQSARTSDLIFSIPEIVSYASRYFTLLPGDVIYTGTPGTTASLSAGDRVEVEVEGVGVLENHVESG